MDQRQKSAVFSFTGARIPFNVLAIKVRGDRIRSNFRLDELQERRRELKATAGRFAEVKYWMDAFREHVYSGEKMDTSDAVVLRQLTDRIVVYDDRLEIHLRIGGVIECAYTLT